MLSKTKKTGSCSIIVPAVSYFHTQRERERKETAVVRTEETAALCNTQILHLNQKMLVLIFKATLKYQIPFAELVRQSPHSSSSRKI